MPRYLKVVEVEFYLEPYPLAEEVLPTPEAVVELLQPALLCSYSKLFHIKFSIG